MMFCDPLACKAPARERLVLFRDDMLAIDGPAILASAAIGERVDAVLVCFVGDDEGLDESGPTYRPDFATESRPPIVRRTSFDRVLDVATWVLVRFAEHQRAREAAIARGLSCSRT